MNLKIQGGNDVEEREPSPTGDIVKHHSSEGDEGSPAKIRKVDDRHHHHRSSSGET